MVCQKFHYIYVLLLFVARDVQTSEQCTIGYPGPNASLMCTCNAGYTGGNFIGPYSTTACVRFVSLIPWKPSFASVVNGHVRFDRTLSQYLGAEPLAFNIATNTGFTIVVVLQFTGSILSDENILHLWIMGTTRNLHSIQLKRNRWFQNLYLRVYDNQQFDFWSGKSSTTFLFVQDVSWGTVVIRYSSSTQVLSFSVNGYEVVSYIGYWPDRNLAGINIGRAGYYDSYDDSQQAYTPFNGNMTGVFVVDEYLTTQATTEIANMMTQGVDLTDTICPSGNACTACAPATYKISAGSSPCLTCPANKTSPVGSRSSDACISIVCNAGYTDPSGGPCTVCDTGTYKNTTGSAACTACVAGTYSTTPAATTCVSCPDNSNSPTAAAACMCDAGFYPI